VARQSHLLDQAIMFSSYIYKADETYLRRSAKGQPKEREKLGRPPRRRGGGGGGGGGRSPDQVPVFLAQDRSGAVVGRVVDRFDRNVAATLLRQAVASDAILCTDGHKAYMGAARELGLQHERLIPKNGGRVRGPFHVQNVNNLHSRFKDWLRRFRGVSTARLPLYVAWFNRITQAPPEREHPNQMLQHILATATTS
jgi:transposase-like protein